MSHHLTHHTPVYDPEGTGPLTYGRVTCHDCSWTATVSSYGEGCDLRSEHESATAYELEQREEEAA